jgi:hypothetical protein
MARISTLQLFFKDENGNVVDEREFDFADNAVTGGSIFADAPNGTLHRIIYALAGDQLLITENTLTA